MQKGRKKQSVDDLMQSLYKQSLGFNQVTVLYDKIYPWSPTTHFIQPKNVEKLQNVNQNVNSYIYGFPHNLPNFAHLKSI